jgi:predicted HicB family RNase H-like nuclease
MTDRLKYKDFIGSVHYSTEDEVFYGKIEGVNDLVTFEGNTVIKLKKAFKEAVNDYLELCAESGKQIYKSFKGSFNVRVNPELHSKAFELALLEGKTLNQFIKEAIELKIKTENTSL